MCSTGSCPVTSTPGRPGICAGVPCFLTTSAAPCPPRCIANVACGSRAETRPACTRRTGARASPRGRGAPTRRGATAPVGIRARESQPPAVGVQVHVRAAHEPGQRHADGAGEVDRQAGGRRSTSRSRPPAPRRPSGRCRSRSARFHGEEHRRAGGRADAARADRRAHHLVHRVVAANVFGQGDEHPVRVEAVPPHALRPSGRRPAALERSAVTASRRAARSATRTSGSRAAVAPSSRRSRHGRRPRRPAS